MSTGALREMTRACLGKFKSMAKAIPQSEKKHLITVFKQRVQILEGF